jgi:hypothetical protein
MRQSLFIFIALFISYTGIAQIDPVLLRKTEKDTSGLLLNMDAVYNRPLSSVR